MDRSAMTRSATASSLNMSSRMLPALTISAVVSPSISRASRAGAISPRWARSKSTPFFRPNGRTTNARIATSGLRRRRDESPELRREIDLSGGRPAHAQEVIDAIDGIELADRLGLEPGQSERLESGRAQVGRIASVQEMTSEVLRERDRLVLRAPGDHVTDLAVDRRPVDTAPDDAAIHVLVDRSAVHQRAGHPG